MVITCKYCGNQCDKKTGHVNRALKTNAKLFCSRACFGLDKRISLEEKKLIKKEYDKEYRLKNSEKKKQYGKEYHKKTYDPIKASVDRKAKMHIHVERMRQPKWVEYKKKYDKIRQAKLNYGEFWESALLIRNIEANYENKEAIQINNLNNKSQKRKRRWQSKQS